MKDRNGHVAAKANTIEMAQADITFPDPIYEIEIGGEQFAVMTIEIDMGLAKSIQKHYATVHREHFIIFAVSSQSEADFTELEQIIGTLAFY